jgi:hypothetical protein
MGNLSRLPNDFIADVGSNTRGSIHMGLRALYTLPSALTPLEKQELFLRTYSFTFVRHPFVRDDWESPILL